MLLGSLPGVYLGARVSARAPDYVVRPALVFVLVASALKLLGMATTTLGYTLAGVLLVGLPCGASWTRPAVPSTTGCMPG